MPTPRSIRRDRRRKSLGARGEQLAAEHLERLGWRVLARNHRTRHGELDLVATDARGTVIVFVEVKTRTAGGEPWDSLHAAKREQVRAMASAWLSEVRDRPWASDLRFDAIGITLDGQGELVRLDHLEGAF